MTLWLVSWAVLSYSCPGGLFSGWTPEKLKPYVCESTLRVEHRLASREDDVLKILRNEVPDVKAAKVSLVKDGRLKDVDVVTILELDW